LGIIFNESAFKHGVSESNIRNAMATFLYDEADVDDANKFLLIGFDLQGNLLEVIYNVIDDETINVFHAMKCRKEYLQLIAR
jgi:hypothetical protein